MMKREFYNDDLEQTLREKTKGYKMYPSDKVWKNIHNRLRPSSGTGKYLAGVLLLLFLTGGGYYLFTLQTGETPETKVSLQARTELSVNKAMDVNQSKAMDVNQSIEPLTKVRGVSAEKYHPVVSKTFSEIKSSNSHSNGLSKTEALITLPDFVKSEPDILSTFLENGISVNNITNDQERTDAIFKSGDNYTGVAKNQLDKESNVGDLTSRITANIPTIRPPFRKRTQWEFFITPSTSYRILFRNLEGFAVPNQSNLSVDQAVKHSPSLGMEIGGNLLFHINKNLRLVAGAQLNYTRYNVNAYSSVPTYATVALNGGYSQAQSIRVLTSYRNFSGYKDANLKNETVQVAIPLGMEMRLAGDDKLEWNMGATLQPTYFLMNKGYMITNDLKNYINKPDFLQHLNLNTGIETSISWTMGSTRWNAGPQIRYQLFSNYDKKYPFKEHIVDYGLKIGFTKTIK